jgi:hypothetical protein
VTLPIQIQAGKLCISQQSMDFVICLLDTGTKFINFGQKSSIDTLKSDKIGNFDAFLSWFRVVSYWSWIMAEQTRSINKEQWKLLVS